MRKFPAFIPVTIIGDPSVPLCLREKSAGLASSLGRNRELKDVAYATEPKGLDTSSCVLDA